MYSKVCYAAAGSYRRWLKGFKGMQEMLKRFAVFILILILTAAISDAPFVFADSSQQEDVFVITSISPQREDVFAGTAIEDTDAYEFFIESMIFQVFVSRQGSLPMRAFVPISSWNISAYNPNVPGVYTIHGEIDYSSFAIRNFPDAVLENPENLRPAIIITVHEPRVPVIDEESIRRGSRQESGVRHWTDSLDFTVNGLNPHLGWDITVWQSNDDGDTWLNITSSGRLSMATDGFTVSGLEESRDYGFKINVNGDGVLQGMSEPVFVTLDENNEYGINVGGERTGRRPDGSDVLTPIDPDDDPNDTPKPPPTQTPTPPAPTPTPTPEQTRTRTSTPPHTHASAQSQSPAQDGATSPAPDVASSQQNPVPQQTPAQSSNTANGSDSSAEYDIIGETAVLKNQTVTLAMLEQFAQKGLSVTFTLPTGTLTLDSDAVKSTLAAASGADVTVSLTQAVSLTEAQQSAVNPDDIVYKITMMSGTQLISSFDGNLTVTVPYFGNIPVVVWYLSNDGELDGVWFRYDLSEQTVSFMTNHLSIYVVAPVTEAHPDSWTLVWITGGISLIAAGLFLIIWRRREKRSI